MTPFLPELRVPSRLHEGAEMTTIKKISTYLLGQDQIFVKIETSEPGLIGWGSAAFAGHHKLIAISVDKYLSDFLVGKEITEIEDIWQTSQVNPLGEMTQH